MDIVIQTVAEMERETKREKQTGKDKEKQTRETAKNQKTRHMERRTKKYNL